MFKRTCNNCYYQEIPNWEHPCVFCKDSPDAIGREFEESYWTSSNTTKEKK